MTLVCKLGNPTHLAWCSPCRSVGDCLELSLPGWVRDNPKQQKGTPQPFSPKLTDIQKPVVEQLKVWIEPWRRSYACLDNDDMTGNDAYQLDCSPHTMTALWRKGWVVRSMMDHEGRAGFDKWLLTRAAVEYLIAQVDRNPKGHDPAEGHGRNDD